MKNNESINVMEEELEQQAYDTNEDNEQMDEQ
jgi:hypothetical protein